jgi:hypothetical protein
MRECKYAGNITYESNKEKLMQLYEEKNSIAFNKKNYNANLKFKIINEFLGSSRITENNLINHKSIPFNFNYMDEF